ncbi:MAG: anaerobic ribonucleoside-triphosphate reductase activating protein [Ruminococcaceae bacterium]|nr:anaerobic ribonucleoside-triphosphate reductase activating protein [Oscillospiraceae bacterium]
MNYATIKKRDIANGVGVRVSLFVSGCTHRCKNCFNKETWDFNYGEKFTDETVQQILFYLEPDYVNGLSLLGGEPFEVQNQEELTKLLKAVKEKYPQKDVWCYTGYLFDKELLRDSRARCEYTDEMLSYIDILVDGRFIEEQKDISLQFRGSKNQRIIDVKRSLSQNEVVLWDKLIK